MYTRRLLLVGCLLLAGIVAGALWGDAVVPGGSSSRTAQPTVLQPEDTMVVLDEPLPGASVTSPLRVRGKARGNWYFEASFPVTLSVGATVIAQAPAQAQSDWMTTDWVPFDVTLTFAPQPPGTPAVLTLTKDNPSGLPQFDDSRTVNIILQ